MPQINQADIKFFDIVKGLNPESVGLIVSQKIDEEIKKGNADFLKEMQGKIFVPGSKKLQPYYKELYAEWYKVTTANLKKQIQADMNGRSENQKIFTMQTLTEYRAKYKLNNNSIVEQLFYDCGCNFFDLKAGNIETPAGYTEQRVEELFESLRKNPCEVVNPDASKVSDLYALADYIRDFSVNRYSCANKDEDVFAAFTKEYSSVHTGTIGVCSELVALANTIFKNPEEKKKYDFYIKKRKATAKIKKLSQTEKRDPKTADASVAAIKRSLKCSDDVAIATYNVAAELQAAPYIPSNAKVGIYKKKCGFCGTENEFPSYADSKKASCKKCNAPLYIGEELGMFIDKKEFVRAYAKYLEIIKKYPTTVNALEGVLQKINNGIKDADSKLEAAKKEEYPLNIEKAFEIIGNVCRDHIPTTEYLKTEEPIINVRGLVLNADNATGQILLKWNTCLEENVEYYIVRKAASKPQTKDDGQCIAKTKELTYCDGTPKLSGQLLYYAVFVRRKVNNDEVFSSLAALNSITLKMAPHSIACEQKKKELHFNVGFPLGCEKIRVERSDGGGQTTTSIVEKKTGGGVFVDTTAQQDITYKYKFYALYGNSESMPVAIKAGVAEIITEFKLECKKMFDDKNDLSYELKWPSVPKNINFSLAINGKKIQENTNEERHRLNCGPKSRYVIVAETVSNGKHIVSNPIYIHTFNTSAAVVIERNKNDGRLCPRVTFFELPGGISDIEYSVKSVNTGKFIIQNRKLHTAGGYSNSSQFTMEPFTSSEQYFVCEFLIRPDNMPKGCQPIKVSANVNVRKQIVYSWKLKKPSLLSKDKKYKLLCSFTSDTEMNMIPGVYLCASKKGKPTRKNEQGAYKIYSKGEFVPTVNTDASVSVRANYQKTKTDVEYIINYTPENGESLSLFVEYKGMQAIITEKV